MEFGRRRIPKGNDDEGDGERGAGVVRVHYYGKKIQPGASFLSQNVTDITMERREDGKCIFESHNCALFLGATELFPDSEGDVFLFIDGESPFRPIWLSLILERSP